MVTFTLNGTPLVAPGNPGLGNPVLKTENQQADTLTVVHSGRTVRFDDAPLFAFNDRLVLTRDPGDGSGAVTVFIGTIQEIPRRLGIEETITYVAHGPWQWLSTFHYLQTYKIADNPALEVPTLIGAYLGRIVIGQAPDGTRQQLHAALADIINWAIGSGCPILLGSITGFDFEVPWDQATDLTCDQAITRLLQSWAPDAVVTWDYTTTTGGAPTPTISIARRAALPVKTLAVAPVGEAGIDSAYVPFESIDIVPLYAQQCSGVVLLYPKINSSGSAPWVTVDVDKYPSGITGREPRSIVRTIELAGERVTLLTQACTVLPLAAALGNGTPNPTVITAHAGGSPGDFNALVAFWKRKVPSLAHADVVIKGFKNRLRRAAPISQKVAGVDTQVTPTLNTALVNELVLPGAITPWMENNLGVVAQAQNYECRIAFSVAGVDQTDTNGFGIVHTAGVMATSAATKIYTMPTAVDGGDVTPVGLAQTVHAVMSQLHYNGSLVIVEREASLAVRVGHVVNLSGSLSAWSSMAALVQGATYDLDQARSTFKVGPPAQLGADSLAALFRVNRLRVPVTASDSRVTGIA